MWQRWRRRQRRRQRQPRMRGGSCGIGAAGSPAIPRQLEPVPSRASAFGVIGGLMDVQSAQLGALLLSSVPFKPWKYSEPCKPDRASRAGRCGQRCRAALSHSWAEAS